MICESVVRNVEERERKREAREKRERPFHKLCHGRLGLAARFEI